MAMSLIINELDDIIMEYQVDIMVHYQTLSGKAVSPLGPIRAGGASARPYMDRERFFSFSQKETPFSVKL